MKCEVKGCHYKAQWLVTTVKGDSRVICEYHLEVEGWNKGHIANGQVKFLEDVMGKLPRTAEFREKVIDLVEDKCLITYKSIADELGVTDPSLHAWDKNMGKPIRALLDGKPIPPIPKKYAGTGDTSVESAPETEKEPAAPVGLGGPGPADPEEDHSDIQIAIKNLFDAASKKYEDAQAEMERIDMAIGHIEKAAEILTR